MIFDDFTPSTNDITLIMGRSMMTLPYKDKKDYSNEQLLTMHLLFSSKLISNLSVNVGCGDRYGLFYLQIHFPFSGNFP